MRYLLISLLFLSTFSLPSHAFNKSDFDILEDAEANRGQELSLARIPYPGLDFLSLDNGTLQATLLKEGYFTLGTSNGDVLTELDNNIPLTYGHPFAKTSYPIINLNGTTYRIDQLFSDAGFTFESLGDTSISITLNNGVMICHFEIYTSSSMDADDLYFRMLLENIDASPTNASIGFLIDPALGTWGDGALAVNGVPIGSSTVWEQSDLVSEMIIEERRNFNNGSQVIVDFPNENLPVSIQAGNWSVLAGHEDLLVEEIYDLAILWASPVVTLNTVETLTSGFSLSLGNSDYPDGPFIRSQLPRALDSWQGLVNPRNTSCFSIIKNAGSMNYNDLTLTLSAEQLFEPWTSEELSLSAFGVDYTHIPIHFPEIYENRAVPLTLQLKQGDVVLDVIQQNCFIPSSPYSDTGLVVLADSVLIHEYPLVSARFDVSQESTGQYFFDLSRENILLTEDQTRIYDFSLIRDTTAGGNSVDVVFVLDVTGSMGGEITDVKNNLGAFANSLEEQGLDYRLAMVTFLDVVENVYDFTADVDLFQTYIDAQDAHGGDDWKENSLDAIYAATQLQFRDQSTREFIWITDAGYHINTGPTSLTVEDVVDALLMNGITCHAVAGSDIQVQYTDPITYPTGGDWFDINGNFLDILLQISEFGGSNKYLLAYNSPNTGSGPRNIGIEVHYAGMGGFSNIEYTAPEVVLKKATSLKVVCYPNPFNPSITIDLEVPESFTASAEIFNIRGQLIRQLNTGHTGSRSLRWDAKDLKGRDIAAGVYLLQVNLLDESGTHHSSELIKIIHAR